MAAITILVVFFVQSLDDRRFMRLAENSSLVLIVEDLCTQTVDINGITDILRVDRLTATGDTAAGAAHDFNEGPVSFAGSDLFHNFVCSLGAGCNCDLDGHTCDLKGSFLECLVAADSFVNDFSVIVAGEPVVSGSECCFHNTAGGTEDDSCAGIFTERIVKFFIGQVDEVQTLTLDHARELTGGDGNINVRNTCSILIIALDFVLLSSTRHDSNDVNVLGVDAFLFCVPGLDDRTGHLHRGLAGGQMIDFVRIVLFAETDPTGRARGDHRENTAVLNAVEKFGSFFNDGNVSTEVDVEDLVCTETAERCNHLAFNTGTDRHAEFFTECCTDSGSGHHDDMLGGISESCPNLFGVVLFGECAGRANDGTLTAGDTGSIVEIQLECLTDIGIDTTVVCTEDTDELLVTNSDTAAAEDTLVVVTDKVGSGIVDCEFRLEAFKCGSGYTVVIAELLQFAVGGTRAGKALLVVGGKNQFERHLARCLNLCGIGLDFHTFGDRVYTCGNETACAGCFNNADTACTNGIDFLHIAEGGDFNTRCSCGFQNRGACRYADGNTVYFAI